MKIGKIFKQTPFNYKTHIKRVKNLNMQEEKLTWHEIIFTDRWAEYSKLMKGINITVKST